jgi:oligoendopeptidase F
MFVTLDGNNSDYMSIAHEFGHFYDIMSGYGMRGSVDIMEIASQGLELLTLTRLKDHIGSKEYNHILYTELEDMMLMLIYQAFYSKFEHIVYSIPYNQVTIERLNDAVVQAAGAMSLNTYEINQVSDILIPHFIIEPLYVQSYCTSGMVALEIYFEELSQKGAGMAMYHKLIRRSSTLSFGSYIELVEIDSPFERGCVKFIADNIHYVILGSHYFQSTGGENTANAEIMIPSSISYIPIYKKDYAAA